MTKNQKPWSAANVSQNDAKGEQTVKLEVPVDAETRNTVFHICPTSRQELVSMYIPVYADDKEVGWEWTEVAPLVWTDFPLE
jgi:hypothetical protein